VRLLILFMLLALVPFSYAKAFDDDVTTLDLDAGTIDYLDATTPDINEGSIGYRDEATTPGINEKVPFGYRDDITTPDINEGATGQSRRLDRILEQHR
jgi:hypothetical protein